MIALSYLIFFGIYIFLMLAVIRRAWRKGFEKGSRTRASVYAALGFLAVYLPIFWNHIPVTLAHKAMCARDAGFTQFVPAEKWLLENRGRVSALRGKDLDAFTEIGKTQDGFTRYLTFGGLLESQRKGSTEKRLSMKFSRVEMRTVDSLSGQVLIRNINYSVGPREDARFWLVHHSCFDGSGNNGPVSKYFRYRNALKEEGK